MKAARVFGERVHRTSASSRYRMTERLPILAEAAAAIHPVAPPPQEAGPAPIPDSPVFVPRIQIETTSSDESDDDVWAA